MQPLILEWEPGSDRVGDFTWTGFNEDCAVRADVLDVLAAEFRGLEPGPVEMFQARNVKRPLSPTRRSRPRVWLPYAGPELKELWVTGRATLAIRRSNIDAGEACSVCGVTPYRLRSLDGLVVHAADADVFRITEFLGCVYCTDAFKQHVQDQGSTGIEFGPAGEIL